MNCSQLAAQLVDVPFEANPATDGRLVGFIGRRRNVSKAMSFADLYTPSGQVFQILSRSDTDSDLHEKFRSLKYHVPIYVEVQQAQEEGPESSQANDSVFVVKDIQPFNNMPDDVIVSRDAVFPPSKRHLQIRFHNDLKARLEFRSWLKGVLSERLRKKGFTDIETPTLFKTTSEGAREFLVPTRQQGTAYALSQSPQQYKQALIASGVMRYMQWARCYRDEDARTDRQPEFTQLDMEWAFAGAAKVQEDVNDIVLGALSALRPAHSYKDTRNGRVPVVSAIANAPPPSEDEPPAHRFTSIKFAESIARYGSDKPDLRIPGRIHAIPDLEEFKNFASMITHHSDPLIEVFCFRLDDCPPERARRFVADFMKNLPHTLANNPDGTPQVLVSDWSKPLGGFSSLGHNYDKVINLVTEGGEELNDGDLVVFQAREKPVGQYCSGSTKIGEIRSRLWKALVEEDLMKTPRLGEPGSLQFVWVTEFPMFKPSEEGEPNQGTAGLSACHHPFTAPLTQADFELLDTNPLQAKSAAYDLVLNGVEIGGGSQRIHLADVQTYIMEHVLKITPNKTKEFSHLFDALRTGCPPHAGFALGFDRLVALMTDTSTVRDVIAFPKTMKGEDLFVGSPSKVDDAQLRPYGLAKLRS
ncbi:hypothetical protein S40288_02265 [Stachybotrys chartarum IBT 40288]|nr:hypothetical protein S40288_02265 [Stachybotrys chartarum IBT 40288]